MRQKCHCFHEQVEAFLLYMSTRCKQDSFIDISGALGTYDAFAHFFRVKKIDNDRALFFAQTQSKIGVHLLQEGGREIMLISDTSKRSAEKLLNIGPQRCPNSGP